MMASIQVEEERLPASRSHVAMASVMARILSGGTVEGEKKAREEEEIDEGKPRVKKTKYSSDSRNQPKISQGDQGGGRKEVSHGDIAIGDVEDGVARHSGPALADVVRLCHRLPADYTVEEERQLQSMATKGGEWVELIGNHAYFLMMTFVHFGADTFIIIMT